MKAAVLRRPWETQALWLVPAAGLGIALNFVSVDLLVPACLLLVVVGAGMLGSHTFVLAGTVTSFLAGSSLFLELHVWSRYGRFVFLGGLIACSFLHARASVAGSKANRGFTLGVIVLGAVAVASSSWSQDPLLSLERGSAFLLLLLALNAVGRSRWSSEGRFASDVSVVAGVVGATMIVGLVMSAVGAEWTLNHGRLQGVLENPNSIGVAVSLTTPLFLALISRARGSQRGIWVGMLTVSWAALLLSESRAGMVATIVGVLAFVAFRGRFLQVALAVSIVALLGLGVTVSGSSPEFLGRFQESGGSGRLHAWGLAIEMVSPRPITGFGFGTTEQVFGPVAFARFAQNVTDANKVFEGSNIHNGFLQVFFELGAVGVIAALLPLGILARRSLRSTRSPWTAATAAMVIAGFFSQLFESGLTAGGSIFGLLFWLAAFATFHLPRDGGGPANALTRSGA